MTRYFDGESVLVVGDGPLAEAAAIVLSDERAAVVVTDDVTRAELPERLAGAVILVGGDGLGSGGMHGAAAALFRAESVLQRVRPALTASARGAVVLVAPGLGSELILGPAGFAAAVAGLAAAARGWAVELGAEGIRINTVRPGILASDTALTSRTVGVDVGYVPLVPGDGRIDRWGTATDVANAIAFLLSEDSRYLTGAELHVDGAASRSRNSAAIALWNAGLEG